MKCKMVGLAGIPLQKHGLLKQEAVGSAALIPDSKLNSQCKTDLAWIFFVLLNTAGP